MKNYLRNIAKIIGVEAAGRLVKPDSYLHTSGWYKSVRLGKSVDRKGNDVAWLTYPFLDFLEGRINNEHSVFEFGSGASTLYFANKVNKVTSVEHDKEWASYVEKQMQATNLSNGVNLIHNEPDKNHKNIDRHTLSFTESGGEYVNALSGTGARYDLIVVDGIYRNSCIEKSTSNLTPAGVIIVDNTNYERELESGIDHLISHNFKRLDFWGMCAIYGQKGCTSVFYKKNNCFDI